MTMMKASAAAFRLLQGLGLLSVGVALFAQVKDVDGWDKIKWGMTFEDARTAYGVNAATKPGANGDALQTFLRSRSATLA